MDEREKQQYNAYMEEYKALRGEITSYSQRIDRTVGVYFSALFGVFGFLLRPDSEFAFAPYIERLHSSISLLGLLLFIAVLNCLLLIRIQSFYLAVLAMSQYTSSVLRPQVSKLLSASVLAWDEPHATRAKQYWLPVRTTAQGSFALVAMAASILVAVESYSVAISNSWLLTLLVVLLMLLAYVCHVFAKILVAGRQFHEPAALIASIEGKLRPNLMLQRTRQRRARR